MRDDHDEPQTPPGGADLKLIISAFDSAVERLHHSHAVLREEVARLNQELATKNRELARKNRLADLGRTASHVAHEIRNAMVPARLYFGLLRRRLTEDTGSLQVLDKVTAAFTTVDATVEDLLHFAADRDPARQIVSPREILEEVERSIAPQLEAQRVRLSIDVPAAVTISADPNMLRRCVLNLILNALDAMPDGGEIVVSCYEDADGLELEIADSGCGLSEESLQRAFEPFFTTKSHGTGLGLAIVDHIVRLHGGRVLAANCPEGGAAISLRFPTALREVQSA